MDSRLRTELIFVEKCPNCGASINQKVSISGNFAPECQFCKNPFSWDFLNELKLKTMNKIYSRDLKEQQTLRPLESQKKEFKMGTFIFLALFCWPIAIYYAISRERNRNW